MDVLHRILWAVIALALLGIGAVGLLVGTGVFGPELQTAVALSAAVPAELERPGQMTLVGLGLGGLVAAALGLLLIKAAVWIPRMGSGVPVLRLSPRAGGPVTVVRGAALQHGLQRDLERVPGVAGAKTVLSDLTHEPRIQIRLDITSRAGLQQAQQGVQQALQRLATTAGTAPASVEVTVRLHPDTRRAL